MAVYTKEQEVQAAKAAREEMHEQITAALLDAVAARKAPASSDTCPTPEPALATTKATTTGDGVVATGSPSDMATEASTLHPAQQVRKRRRLTKLFIALKLLFTGNVASQATDGVPALCIGSNVW